MLSRISLGVLTFAAPGLCQENGAVIEDCDAKVRGDGMSLLQSPKMQQNMQVVEAVDARSRCREVMNRAPESISGAMLVSDLNVCEDFDVTQVQQSDFREGTYIIRTPGIYQISEDIVMAPETDQMMPAMDSETHLPSDGYWLGFFAAIAVASDNVFLDLNNKTISMSEEFLMRQRFFSVIQLGERPFKAETGPPQFSALTDTFPCACNFVLSDGVLGKSAHMGVHGVDNNNIWIDHVRIRDFETGGIQLNGASNVHISDTVIGPSLGQSSSVGTVPGLATLSHAVLLMRISEAFTNLQIDQDRWSSEVEAFTNLQASIERFIAQKLTGSDIAESEQVFKNEAGLPDGSALYGIVFHAAKPAIHDFASCPQFEGEEDGSAFGPLNLTKVTVKKLKLKTDEVVSFQAGGRPVMGPAGDVLQVFRIRDDDGNYVPNVLSEAQLAMGRLRLAHAGEDEEETFRLFGATNIPAEVIAWANGTKTWDEMISDVDAVFVCQKDAMTHHNKGIVGVRIEYYNEVSLSDVQVRKVENVGRSSNVSHCLGDEFTYKGNDARGFSMSHVSQAHMGDITVQSVKSTFGFAYGVEERVEVTFGSPLYNIDGVEGAMGSTQHQIGLIGMLGSDS